MSSERDRLVERRDLVERDLEELAAQVAEGEIDDVTADRLRGTFQAELDALEAALRSQPEPPPDGAGAAQVTAGRRQRVGSSPQPPAAPESPSGEPRSPRRIVAGAVLLIVLFSVAIALAARDATDDAEPQSSPGELLVDPASVSDEQLEAVVAANPNINGMRMALADRYFAGEDYGAALDHYLYIADNNPTAAEETKALGRVGWMAYRTGLAEEADQYVAASLAIDPHNPEALVYRGFVTLYGIGDVAAAIPQLELALGLPNLSTNVISQIDDAIADARNRLQP